MEDYVRLKIYTTAKPLENVVNYSIRYKNVGPETFVLMEENGRLQTNETAKLAHVSR